MIWIILCIIICGGIIVTAAIISNKLIKKIKKQYNEHFELSKDLEKLKNEIKRRIMINRYVRRIQHEYIRIHRKAPDLLCT